MCVVFGTSARASTVLLDSLAPALPGASVSSAPLIAADMAEVREVVVALRMRDVAGLQARLVSERIIPMSEMEALYLPFDSDFQAVTAWLKATGLTVSPKSGAGLNVFAKGNITQLQIAFNVAFGKVNAEGQVYTSTMNAPSVPDNLALAIVAVLGLQPEIHYNIHNGIAPHGPPIIPNDQPAPPPPTFVRPANPPADYVVPASGAAQAPSPNAVSNGKPPYKVGDIQSAYNVTNLPETGANQTIAIIMAGRPLVSDITSFWTDNQVGQTTDNLQFISVGGGVKGQGELVNQREATLDVAWSSGIAPGAAIRLYIPPTLDYVNLYKAYDAVLDDVKPNAEKLRKQPNLHILSLSYGLNEDIARPDAVKAEAQHMMALASQGITIFAASGDGGSNPNLEGQYDKDKAPLRASTPASAPGVTAVGGTKLSVDGSGVVNSEVGWSLDGGKSASGGGISGTHTRPSWQKGQGFPEGSMRLVPDISSDGDANTGVYLYVNGATNIMYGGTSLSAPTWAGFCARINQARANFGNLEPLGNSFSPLIYSLAGTTGIRDITSGNNGKYFATEGYDLVTGLGVPNVATIHHSLAAPFFRNEMDIGGSFYRLPLPNGTPFGQYSVAGPGYAFPTIFHSDLGFEYVFDANDGQNGIYLYDFTSQHYFYTSPSFPFPFLYDFTYDSVIYYYPADHPTMEHIYSSSPRNFHIYSTGQDVSF